MVRPHAPSPVGVGLAPRKFWLPPLHIFATASALRCALLRGSPTSRAVAQIVLLDNKFATLPYVVGEGRRVIGNIERVSNLFLTKTVYSVLLAVLVGLTGLASKTFGTNPLLFPFQPIHVTIAAWFTIGIPAFILSLTPNNERAGGDDAQR